MVAGVAIQRERWQTAMQMPVAGIIVALSGIVVPGMRWLYDYAWFAGFGVSGALYVQLMRRTERA